MNYLAIFEDELLAPNQARLSGSRAKYALEVHKPVQGLEMSAFVVNGAIKKATVTSITPDQILLTLRDFAPQLPVVPFELIVAVPRPQTVRKVLQLTATFGIRALHLIRTENVIKSYLSSKRLDPESLKEDLLLGMEQSGTSVTPEVFIHHRFQPFIEDLLPKRLELFKERDNTPPLTLIADTHFKNPQKLSDLPKISTKRSVFIALGPEAGWNLHEVHKFQELGFSVISLGDRILRVDTACVSAIAQTQMLCH